MATFGFTGAGNSGIIHTNEVIGSKATCPEPGIADSITARLYAFNPGSRKVKYALYKVSDESLVGITEEITVDVTAEAEHTANFIVKPALENVEYRIQAHQENLMTPCLRTKYVDAGTDVEGEDSTYPTFPDPLTPSVAQANHRACIYCTYTPCDAPSYANPEWVHGEPKMLIEV